MKRPIYPIKLYAKNKLVLLMVSIALLLNIATWVWLLWNIRPQEDLIFLHYNVLFGVDLIGEWWRIIYLPITGFCIILINTVLGWITFHKDTFVAIICLASSILCQIFILVAAMLLVFLNV